MEASMDASIHRSADPVRCVLVPTDFSEGATAALERAVRLPLAPGARLHLVHVLPAALPRGVRSRAEAEARRSLARAFSVVTAAAAVCGGELRVSSEILRGQPFVEIIRSSRAIGADLVVLGRHGRRPVRDMFIGTTAQRVIRKGDVAVLAVAGEAAAPYRRPIVAADLGDAALRSLGLALRVLGSTVKTVTVLHAYQMPFEGLIDAGSDRRPSEFHRELKGRAAARLARLLGPVEGAAVRWRTVLRRGDPRTVIVKELLLRRADLVVLGTHGRSGMAHALLGSVAEWVVSCAPCDVLVARPERFSFELP
jgi:nucleotide-binding universal stress UspA family protein